MTDEHSRIRYTVAETDEGRIAIQFFTLVTERVSTVVVLKPEDAAALAQQIADILQSRGATANTTTTIEEDKP